MADTKINIAIDDVIALAQCTFYRSLTRSFKDSGKNITVEQWTMLKHIYENKGITQQAIANCSNKDKHSVCRLIDNMQKQQWVVRMPDKADKRINHLYLTEQGKKLHNQLYDLVQNYKSKAVKGISVTELKACSQILNRVTANMAR